MNKDEAAKLWADIKENRRKLDACPRHEFPDWPRDISTWPRVKVKCARCSGSMNMLDIGTYARGYGAATGDSDAILPGFYTPSDLAKLQLGEIEADFEKIWAEIFVAAGYQYGDDALQNVMFGFAIARGMRP